MEKQHQLDFEKRTQALLAQMTLDEKLMLLTTHHNAIPRLDMKEFYIGTEVARGYVGREAEKVSTVFPQPVGLTGTFDTELMHQLGEIAADEARAYYNEDPRGGLALWGPTVDMVRDPRWGRTEEAYGEDVCLAGEMTAAYTKGMAGDNGRHYKTLPTLKHFCANNNEEHRGDCNAYLPPRLKYEYYYAAFMNAIRFGGAKSIMAAYNEINGVPALCNPELNTILKKQWGLWFVVSDGGDFSQNVTYHHYCDTHAESLSYALKAGADTMTDGEDLVRNAAKEALASGLITESDIDLAVSNALFARFALGQFDADCPYNDIGKGVIDSDAHKKINERATREQVTLLKNNGILPLKHSLSKIAVVGALADENLMDWYTGYSSGDISILQGMKAEFAQSEILHDSLWDYVCIKAPNGKYLSTKENGDIIADAETVGDAELFEWQDWGENWNNLFSVKYRRYVRLFDDNSFRLHNRRIYDWYTRETLNKTEYFGKYILAEFLHGRRVVCDADGNLSVRPQTAVTHDCLFDIEVVESGKDRATNIAASCDCVIYCVGNHPVQVAKECYDRKTLALNIQPGMATHLHAHNPNTILTVVSSYPYSICAEQETLPGILYTSHAGAYLGSAVAQTLSGNNNPAGRLALTWYRSEADLPDLLNYDIETAKSTYMYFEGKPLYPFGHGLSYSAFTYEGLTLHRKENGSLLASLRITNTSAWDGDEVVQLYFTVADSQVTRPRKKLCGFARVFVSAGETKDVEITIPEHILQIYDVRREYMITEGGRYHFFAGASCEDIRLENTLDLAGSSLGIRPDHFPAERYDASKNIKIFFSKTLSRHYIRVCGWGGDASYGGVPFLGKTKLTLLASSVQGPANITINFGDKENVVIPVAPSNAYDDFVPYTVDLPQDLPETGMVSLSAGDGVGILSIALI